MAFKFFLIPTRDSAAAETTLNAFLRAHRVLAVDRRWVDQGALGRVGRTRLSEFVDKQQVLAYKRMNFG